LGVVAITFRRKHVLPSAEPPRAIPRDEPLSERARTALEEGLASAKRGDIRHLGDFTKYADDSDE
jgi:hypothetical protein